MMNKRPAKRRRMELEDDEPGRSSWLKYQAAHPKATMPRFASPRPQKETISGPKVPEDPKALKVVHLKNPSSSEFYKLVLTFKSSFPLKKIKSPNKISGDLCMCIHGLFNLQVSKCLDGYLEGDMKINKETFNMNTPAEPLNTLAKYKDLFKTWWPCLGTLQFHCNAKFLDFQAHKHNYENRYPKDVFLLNGLVLGKFYIEKILDIMHQKRYMNGQKRKCSEFIADMENGLQFKVEVVFEKLKHKTNLFGLKKIGLLFNDKDWKLQNLYSEKNETDNREFIFEDFETSMEERVNFETNAIPRRRTKIDL